MALLDRVKNILVTPKTEWQVIDGETATPASLLGKYVIPLALIAAIAAFIGMGVIGTTVLGVHIGSIKFGIAIALSSFIGAIVSFYVSTYVIDALATTFQSEKNINKSAQLVAYASTAAYIAGIFQILPALSILGILGLYSIYLFYLGLPVLKKTPADKVVAYMLVGALVVFVISFVVNMLFSKIVYAIVGNPYAVDVNKVMENFNIN